MSETVETEVKSASDKAGEKKSSENAAPDKKNGKKTGKGGNEPKQSFFAGVKAELKKVIWPEKMKIVKNTTAVVLVSIFVAVAVKVSDLLIQAVLDLLL